MTPAASLAIGPIRVWPPVVLAPMAGVTDAPFRALCREYGAGLYVSEMITARAVVEGNPKTRLMTSFAVGETPRSLQLYAVSPTVAGEAVRVLVGQDRVDHVDLNFGCPVPKVTRRGGGAALPWKAPLFAAIVRAAVRAAGPVPVTVKLRLGIDDDHPTYLDAGRIAADQGAAAVALHGRTAAQHYSGTASWAPIAELVAALSVPVLDNGDLWTARDALRMLRETGCAGVVVGRGCMGRPWLFGELAAAFDGRPAPAPPGLHDVARIMRRHAQLMVQWKGEHGIVDFRKHAGWYTKGFAVGGGVRARLGRVASLAELDDVLSALGPDQPYPPGIAEAPRGRTTGAPRRVALPDRWLDDRDAATVDDEVLLAVSGG